MSATLDPRPDDTSLLRAIAVGDADALRQLYHRHSGLLFARATPVGWLILLVRSRAIDRLRTRQTRRRTSEAFGMEPVTATPMPADEAGAAETRGLVRQAMNALPVEQRTLLELAYFGGLSQSEIASQLGEPLGTEKTRIRAGMVKLREQLSSTGERP